MKCPSCGHDEAYLGFSSIDCPNTSCRYYTASDNATTPSTAASTAQNQAGIQGYTSAQIYGYVPTPVGTATLNLTVDITSKLPKRNSVLISIVAHGDPGVPNKNVELLWELPSMATPRICTLTGRHTFLITGVDADGQTVYNTHWQCNLDGVKPTDNWTLTARIFP